MQTPLLLLFLAVNLQAGAGQDLLQLLGNTPLDATECYRIREVRLTRDEAQIFFTDGYLIFAKSTGSSGPTAAFFSADAEGGDAELLLLPPQRSERRALSDHTGSPNMDEHFTQAAMVFTGDTYRELMEEIKRGETNKKSAEMGVLMADRWSPLIKGLGSNFGLRMAADLLSPAGNRKGFFAAALSGNKLGAFNLVFDPRVPEQLLIGSTTESGFDVWSSFTSRSFRGRPYAPEFALSDFRIDTKMDADLTLHSVTHVAVKPPREERALPFEISQNMKITSATVNGAAAEVLTNERSGFFLVLPATPLAAGAQAELVIRHEGKVIQDAGNHVFSVGSRGSWYPNRGRQFARFDMTFRLPKDLDLVAAGDLLEDRIEGIERISHWKTAVPIRLAGFNLGIYDRIRTQHGDLTIEVCANKSAETSLMARPAEPPFQFTQTLPTRPARRPQPPDVPIAAAIVSPKMRLQALAAEMGDVMDFYTARFGPLDLKRLEVTPVPGRFGQGFPGLIYLSTLSYLEPGEKAVASLGQHQQAFFTDLLHAHEAAHQWWGNIVTAGEYHDDWLMESLANYSALLYLEKRKGTKAVDAILENYRQKLLEKNADGDTLESIGPIVQGTRLEASWIPIVYGKGTWILHMLRKQMGDEAFLRMLSALRKEYEDKTITTDDFRLFCARFLPAHAPDGKLETFFDQWVYGTGIPTLKLTSSLKARRVTGTITQSEAGEEFAAEVPLEIQLGKGRTITRTVTAGEEPAAFDLPVPAQPTKVSIDYRSILHR